MRYTAALFSFFVLLLVSCTPKAATGLPVATMLEVGDNEKLSPGETVTVEGHTGSLTFVGVINDSRCPEGANCIQAGAAELSVRITGDMTTKVVIPAEYRTAERIVSDDVVYNVVRLSPYPKEGRAIQPEDYELEVNVSLLRD